MIPKTKTKIEKRIGAFSWLIYGQPKIGKTTFTAQFDKALFIATEAGHKNVEVFKIPADKGALANWSEFKAAVKTIVTEVKAGKFKFETIVIDTVDNLIDLCQDHVCKEMGIKHPEEAAFGKGWTAVRKEFETGINVLLGLGVGVVFISHSQDKEVETRFAKVTKTMTTLSGKVGKFVEKTVDIIGYIGFDNEDPDKRVVSFKGSECLLAGDRTGNLPAITDFNYKNIKGFFND